ncbi:hypothetical protein D3C72_1888000 [compost metagenome]
MLRQQFGDGDIIRVIGPQKTGVIDDGIDRFNRRCGSVQLIEERDAALFERHGNRATTDAQSPYAAHCCLDILGSERLVDKVQIQFLIQIVMKASTEVAWATGQRHAQLGIFVNLTTHDGFLNRENLNLWLAEQGLRTGVTPVDAARQI